MTDAEPPATTSDEPQSLPPAVTDEQFAVRLREERERKHWSQADVARLMGGPERGWHPQTVQKIESGHRKVSVGEAKALAGIFGTTMDRLTWPGRAASAAGLLDIFTGRAESAWEQIAAWTATLLWAQGQLGTTVGEAEAADCLGSQRIRELADGARKAIEMTPEAAVETGRKDHARMRAEGDDPYEDEDRAAGGES